MSNPLIIGDDQIIGSGESIEDSSPKDARPNDDSDGWHVSPKNKDGDVPDLTVSLTPNDEEAPILGAIVIKVMIIWLL